MIPRRALLLSKYVDVSGFRALARLSSIASSVKENNVHPDIKPFNQVPGPGGVYNIPYIGTAFHFQPFS